MAVTGLDGDANISSVVDIAAQDLVPVARDDDAREGHVPDLATNDAAIQATFDADTVSRRALDTKPLELDVLGPNAVYDSLWIQGECHMVALKLRGRDEVERAAVALQEPLARSVQLVQQVDGEVAIGAPILKAAQAAQWYSDAIG